MAYFEIQKASASVEVQGEIVCSVCTVVCNSVDTWDIPMTMNIIIDEITGAYSQSTPYTATV